MRQIVGLVLAIIVVGSLSGFAQETREAQIAAEQAEKAKHLHPYVPSKVEQMFTRLTRGFIETPSGFYPAFGSVYGGGGFTLGGGYRRFYGDRALWNVRGLYSIRSYKLAELSTVSPGPAEGPPAPSPPAGRGAAPSRAGGRGPAQVAFYGLGLDTATGARANLRMQQAAVSAGLRAKPVPWTV